MTSTGTLREEPARFFSTLTSLNNFDKIEIRNVIRGRMLGMAARGYEEQGLFRSPVVIS